MQLPFPIRDSAGSGIAAQLGCRFFHEIRDGKIKGAPFGALHTSNALIGGMPIRYRYSVFICNLMHMGPVCTAEYLPAVVEL